MDFGPGLGFQAGPLGRCTNLRLILLGRVYWVDAKEFKLNDQNSATILFGKYPNHGNLI